MGILPIKDISVAFFMEMLPNDTILEQLIWVEEHCAGRVACDIYRTLTSEYIGTMRGYRANGNVKSCNYWFFELERDAMLFRLTWSPSKMKAHHWLSVRDDHTTGWNDDTGLGLVRRDPLSSDYLVDDAIAHVKCPA